MNTTRQDAAQAFANALRNATMIVELHTSYYTARVKDHDLGYELADSHKVEERELISVHKKLVSGPYLKNIQSCMAEARRIHEKLTTPWTIVGGDGPKRGPRLLGVTMYQEYVEKIGNAKGMAEDNIEILCEHWPEIVDQSIAKLGDVADRYSYPTVEDLRSKFRFDVQFSPVPSADQFSSVNLPPEVMDTLAQRMSEHTKTQAVEAVRHVYQRALDRVQHLYQMTCEEDRRLHESTVEHVKDTADILESFNVTGDPELASIVNDMRELTLTGVDDMRKNKIVREVAADQADKLVQKMESYGDKFDALAA